jgi:hypothetical protein
MPIERYDHYGKPRLSVTEDGNSYLIRDVLTEDGLFSGVCEYAVYEYGGDIRWLVCKEGVEFTDIRPFIAALKTAGEQ